MSEKSDSKIKRFIDKTISVYKSHKPEILLGLTTVGMQAMAVHYFTPGYGDLGFLDTIFGKYVNSVSYNVSSSAYEVADQMYATTGLISPETLFSYKEIFRKEEFSYIYNTAHHFIGGLAIGTYLKKMLDKDTSDMNKLEKTLVSHPKLSYISLASVGYIGWEFFEMAIGDDEILSHDGIKDLIMDYTGAYFAYNKDKIISTLKESDTETEDLNNKSI